MQPNTIALCMIVRDEIDQLPICLQSVQGLVDEIWVVDTGSQDGTPELARALGAQVLQFAWVDDFSAARNFGINHAKSEWILVLDADEQLTEESRMLIPQTLQTEETDGVAAFILPICSLLGDSGHGKEFNYNVRLFRNRPGHRYEGAVHEQIIPSIRRSSPDQRVISLAASVLHSGYLLETLEAKQKPARNLAIIERQLQKNPEDFHLQYHAAVCLYNLERFEESIARLRYILRESQLQQNYVARCAKILVITLRRLGRTDEALATLDKYQHNWPVFTDLQYLRALLLRDKGEVCRALDAAICCRLMGDAPPPYDTHAGVGTFGASRLVGELAEKLGNSQLAEQAYREIPVDRSEFRVCTARWLRLLAKRIGVGSAVMELVRRTPEPRDFHAIADICLLAGLYEPAIQFAERARGIETAERALLLGRCLFYLGRMDEAINTFQKIGSGQRGGATANLWLAYASLASESPALLAQVRQAWKQPHPDNQRLLDLISYLLGGSPPDGEALKLLLPLLRSIAPHAGLLPLQRCLELGRRFSNFQQWCELADVLLQSFGQVELAWQAYGHRQSGMQEPWLEAAIHRRQGHPHLALQAYLRALTDKRALADDFLQAARLSLELARHSLPEGDG